MKLQVLVSTMNQNDYSLLERMNIQSDAIIINQCDKDEVVTFNYKNHEIKWISMSDRGIGISRNVALFNATADFILFADDDLTYEDGYAKEVIKAFETNIKADVICFNIRLINSNKNIGGHRDNVKCKKLHLFNSMRYGATLIGARRKSLLRERIEFSLLFGGGATFNSGEDSIFIRDCLHAGLKLYSHTYCLGNVEDSQSSWYKGTNDKFFRDRGSAYYLIFPKLYILLFLYYAKKMAHLDEKYNIYRIFCLFMDGRKIIRKYR